jgi:hypothetical protein
LPSKTSKKATRQTNIQNKKRPAHSKIQILDSNRAKPHAR